MIWLNVILYKYKWINQEETSSHCSLLNQLKLFLSSVHIYACTGSLHSLFPLLM